MPAKINFSEEEIKQIIEERTIYKRPYYKIAELYHVTEKVIVRIIKEKLGEDNRQKIKINHNFDRFYFYDIDSADKAYWLGFITADGYVNEKKNFLKIKLQYVDKEHLSKFLKAIKADETIKVKTEYHSVTGKPASYITLNGIDFINGLIKQGVRQAKSSKEVPCENVPDKFIPDYIRGLIDGDGHICKRKMDLRGSYIMCKWVQDWLIKNCNVGVTKISYDSNIYRVYFIKNRINVLRKLYYVGLNKNICLDRKYKEAMILMLENLKKS